jgi:hypothetical protein
MPATLGRPTEKPLKGRHRRRMKQRLNKDYGGYGQRWQVEKAQADYPSRRRWDEARRIGYHRRNGVARAGRVLPATPGCLHRRNRMSDNTRRRSAPPRA